MSELTSQLLKYPYQQSDGKGVPEATQIARQWLNEIFKESWRPDDSVRPLVHHGDATSCDALKLTYSASDADGPLRITVYQTVFTIVIAVAPRPPGKLRVLDVARRLFTNTERLNFNAQEGTGVTGRQVSAGVRYHDYDWLDTLVWWSDETLVCFEMLKRTGPGQRTIVRPEAEANRTWFATFE